MNQRDRLDHARHFFETRLWATQLEGASRGRVFLYRLLRTVSATVRGFLEKELTVRAAALTYYSVLSIVPFLAFAFSILKGFGAYHKLMEQAVRPYLHETFAGDQSLLPTIDKMLTFVEDTSVSGLSVVGVLFLVYTSITMLATVETAFNDIWDARTSRPLLRKLTDYTTLMVFGPLLIVAAIAFGGAAQSSSVVEYLHRSMLLGGIVDFVLRLTSIVLGCVALVALYVIMPNVRIRFASALFGGVVAGLLWQGLLLLHVKFQLGVANYNALYSGFAAVPIFLVWLYLSWTIVLIGAQLAASHQYEQRMKQAVRSRHVDQELREDLSVIVAAAVARCFLEGHPPPTALELACALEVPSPPVEEVLDALVRAGLLVQVAAGREQGYDPARDLDAVRMADLEEAVRSDPDAGGLKHALRQTIGPELATLLRAREGALQDAGRVTLRQLATRLPVRIDGVTASSAASIAPAARKRPDPDLPA